MSRKNVFISYSHQDAKWLQRLQTHIKPLVRAGKVKPWDDTQIKPGDLWRDEIDKALADAKVAVLLISADFLASDFVVKHELPSLLAKAQSDGAVILPVVVRASLFKHSDLARFQAVNSPDKPIESLSKAKQEAVLVEVALAIQDAVQQIESETEGGLDNATTESQPSAQKQSSKILFLASNPAFTQPLALDREARSIREKLRVAEHRDAFEFITQWAVRPDDLIQYLNEYTPAIVHFSGHGSKEEELILVDDNDNPKPVSKAALESLFRVLKDNIRVVVLNACYSSAQAEAIAGQIDCTIGMNKAIGDKAAIVFAASFYRALGFGRSVQNAFEQGKTALLVEGIAEENTPELILRDGVDPAKIVLVSG